jgi:3-hydroxyisobutyrate dehydrogenase
MRVGFIGLGNLGTPMARRICEHGFSTTLWARRAASLESFTDLPVHVASTPAELGERSDVVGICVVDDAGVEDVLLGPAGVLGGMDRGGIVLVHSTVHPGTCIRLAELAAANGVEVMDAPVSGGAQGALERRLLVMVGGTVEGFESCQPVLATFGNPVRHLGPLGSGQMGKLVNNALVTANLSVLHDAVCVAEGLGLDRTALIHALQHGSGGSRAMTLYERMRSNFVAASDGAPPHGGRLLRKDVDLVTELAAEHQLDLGYLKIVADRFLSLLGSPSARA